MLINTIYFLWNVAGIIFFTGIGLFLIALSLVTITDWYNNKI